MFAALTTCTEFLFVDMQIDAKLGSEINREINKRDGGGWDE